MTQVFFIIFGLALFTWVGKYFYVLYYYRKQKENINKSEAKVAVLRMLLKAKLRRKGSQLQEQYAEDKTFLAAVQNRLDMLTTFSFNRSSDFEEVVTLLHSLSEDVDLQTVRKMPGLYMAHQQNSIENKNTLLKLAGIVVDADNSPAVLNSDPAEDNVKKTETDSSMKNTAVINDQMPGFNRWMQLMKYDKGNIYIIKEIIETTEELKSKIENYNIEQPNKELHLRAPDLIRISDFEGLRSVVDLDQQNSRKNKELRKNRKLADDVTHLDLNADKKSDVA